MFNHIPKNLACLKCPCHGQFVGPMFSVVVHPAFYHFTTQLAFVALTSPCLSQKFGTVERKTEYTSVGVSIEHKLSWP